jgi:hypothetical protein
MDSNINSLYILDVVTVMGPEIDTSTTIHTTKKEAKAAYRKAVDEVCDDKCMVRLLHIANGAHIDEVACYNNPS